MAKAKLTHVKVPLNDYLYLRDMEAVADFSNDVVEIGRGCRRLGLEGFVCIHCGADTSDPDFKSSDCKFPLSKIKADAEQGKF